MAKFTRGHRYNQFWHARLVSGGIGEGSFPIGAARRPVEVSRDPNGAMLMKINANASLVPNFLSEANLCCATAGFPMPLVCHLLGETRRQLHTAE